MKNTVQFANFFGTKQIKLTDILCCKFSSLS